jgi:hypothetical protein
MLAFKMYCLYWMLSVYSCSALESSDGVIRHPTLFTVYDTDAYMELPTGSNLTLSSVPVTNTSINMPKDLDVVTRLYHITGSYRGNIVLHINCTWPCVSHHEVVVQELKPYTKQWVIVPHTMNKNGIVSTQVQIQASHNVFIGVVYPVVVLPIHIVVFIGTFLVCAMCLCVCSQPYCSRINRVSVIIM